MKQIIKSIKNTRRKYIAFATVILWHILFGISGFSANVDIGIFNTECGEFEVRAKSDVDLTNTSVTNIQFTLKWPENTFNLSGFLSDFGLLQQGPINQNEGFNYAFFISVSGTPINWIAGQEYTLLSFQHDQNGSGYADMLIGDDEFINTNNGEYYFEILGLDETGIIFNHATDSYLGPCGIIDIGIFNTACGEFEVRLKPHEDYPGSALTNLQFTVKWPANTVLLKDFNSTFNVQPQGPVVVENDTNYQVFATATGIPINWTAEEEYVVLTFGHTENSLGYADFLLTNDGWAQNNNGIYYMELLGLDYTGIIYHQAEDVFLELCTLIDIGLYSTGCGEFEVRAKPDSDLLSMYITNIQFTIKWPEYTVQLVDILSTFGLQQQGPTLQDNGHNYAIFITVLSSPITWLEGQEYTIMTLKHDQSGSGYGDFVIADDSFTYANLGEYYFEILGYDVTGVGYHNATDVYLGSCNYIDVGIFNTGCSEFEVRLKPHDDYTGNVLTNLQFTVKWPANTVLLTNFNSTFDLQPQGPVVVENDTNYQIFASATGIPINWIAESEYVVLTFNHDQTGTGYADFEITNGIWSQTNNGLYYVELLGLDYTGIIYNQALDVYIGNCGLIDIGLFETGCATYEVRLKPHEDYQNNVLTNLQFTVKWPANTVDVIDFSYSYFLTQQGPTIVENDTNYAVFATVTASPINWTAENEITIITFSHDQSGEGFADIMIDTTEWAINNNGLYYVELLGLDYTGIVYNNAENSYLGACGVIDLRVILQGAYESTTGMMRTSINAAGNLPNDQHYSISPWNYPGLESMTAYPDSIVDWVLVELRDKTDETLMVERRAGLLTENGIVMDTSLTTGLYFTSAAEPDSFYIVVWHRNHMPVMSGEPVAFPNLGTPYDFTEVVITQPYKHNDPLMAELELNPPGSGKYGMIAGDINVDGKLIYLGFANDRGLILSKIIGESGLPYLNTILTGFYQEDINLDNKLIYLGQDNDRGLILSNLIKLSGYPYLNTIYISVVPGAASSK